MPIEGPEAAQYVRISPEIRERLAALVASAGQREVVAALTGVAGPGGFDVLGVVRIPNAARSVGYFITTKSALARAAAVGPGALLGLFHSHFTCPEPSRDDLAAMTRWPALWIIGAAVRGCPRFTAFRPGVGGAPERIAINVTPQKDLPCWTD